MSKSLSLFVKMQKSPLCGFFFVNPLNSDASAIAKKNVELKKNLSIKFVSCNITDKNSASYIAKNVSYYSVVPSLIAG